MVRSNSKQAAGAKVVPISETDLLTPFVSKQLDNIITINYSLFYSISDKDLQIQETCYYILKTILDYPGDKLAKKVNSNDDILPKVISILENLLVVSKQKVVDKFINLEEILQQVLDRTSIGDTRESNELYVATMHLFVCLTHLVHRRG